ncbi:MAG TPA: RNA polymerase sigma factor [Myxococcaceae bacterium]|nr:RNA polymerase sigma factor [Myxococcaceae bacterium]
MRDQRTFIDRVSAHAGALRRFARRLTRNTADAEDVLQETLVKALQNRDELRDPRQLRPWLLAIVRTSWLNSRRGLRHKLELLDGNGLHHSEASGYRGDLEREILDRSLDDELLAALDTLPDDWREALWLREVEELSYEEIAAVVGCPLGTVRSRLARARAALAIRLGKGAGHGM